MATISNSLNAIWTEYAAKILAQQIDNALLSDYFKATIEPPLMTIDLEDAEFDRKLDELLGYTDKLEQDNERIKVAITTSNTSGTGLISGGTLANYPPAEAKSAGPRNSVTMTITKVVNGHTVTVGSRTYVCGGEEDLANIVITALADMKLGG